MAGFEMKVVITGGNLRESEYMVRTMNFNQINETVRDGFVVEPQGYEGEFIMKQFENALEYTIDHICEELACFDRCPEEDMWDSSFSMERAYWRDELVIYQDIKQVFKECQISNLCNVGSTLEMLNVEYKALDKASNSLMDTTLYTNLFDQIEEERMTLRTKLLAFETLNEFLLYGELS